MKPTAKKIMGRASIFRHKRTRVHGVISDAGSKRFEAHRKKLAKIVGWPPESVSDGDVVEYIARGEDETRAYLAAAKD